MGGATGQRNRAYAPSAPGKKNSSSAYDSTAVKKNPVNIYKALKMILFSTITLKTKV